ncbi:MAG: Lrp/AsnC family transcriptional regulator [Sphingobacteriales bacterium]|jgi:Lrp/AsnC family leucine-responsive transcriptional regulator|nr:Lrp/AsnC family transcriptional regulator [Sphingobacteriales bacterium]
MIGLDSTDFKILKILQENGRITNIQLSMDIGLSPAPTLERVRKLEAQGYINSYHAMVNEELLGLKIKTFIQVSINYQKTDAIKNFSKQIMKIDEVVECHHISGSADFLLKVIVPDIKSYERLILDKISKILEISHLQTMMILSTTKYSHALPLDY